MRHCPLEQSDRLVNPAQLTVGTGQVVAAGQGFRVVGAQEPLGVRHGSLKQSDRLLISPHVAIRAGQIIPTDQQAQGAVEADR